MSLRKKLKLNHDDDQNDPGAESPYFQSVPLDFTTVRSRNIADSLLNIEMKLVSQLNELVFKDPVKCVYNPLEYAYLTHSMFVRKYCNESKKILFLGLNPGPWGMAQTGVPFGEVNITRDWLKIQGEVDKPRQENSARPINGFNCTRSEISGKKFWSLFQNICETPENFFKYSYIHNYCPLLLIKDNGANVTPADLKSTESTQLLKICDEFLSEVIKLLDVEIIVGVGRFTQKRAEKTVQDYKLPNVKVHFLLHPSPRIPLNENWQEKAEKILTDLQLMQYLHPGRSA